MPTQSRGHGTPRFTISERRLRLGAGLFSCENGAKYLSPSSSGDASMIHLSRFWCCAAVAGLMALPRIGGADEPKKEPDKKP